jgi:hypothetical protein
MGISTLQAESQQYDGGDWEAKHAQAVREAKARREAGLSVPGADGAAPPPPDGQDAEDDDNALDDAMPEEPALPRPRRA